MADDAPEKKKKGIIPFILSGLIAVMAAAGGYLAVQSGWVANPESRGPQRHVSSLENTTNQNHDAGGKGGVIKATFIPMDPLLISLGPASTSKHLRFRAQLEVAQNAEADVAAVMPRIIDVLNGYLRAVETGDLQNPTALPRLRAQMLRRIQVVAGRDAVQNLLIMEFVLS